MMHFLLTEFAPKLLQRGLLWVLLGITSAVFAQEKCGTQFNISELNAQQLANYNRYNSYVDSVYYQSDRVRTQVTPSLNSPRVVSGRVLMIPVVFHMVHNNDAENLSDSQLDGQIEILNRDYRRNNLDAGSTPSVFSTGDVEIQFYRACFDPDGYSTSGINRFRTNITAFQRGGPNDNIGQLKSAGQGLAGWDPSRY